LSEHPAKQCAANFSVSKGAHSASRVHSIVHILPCSAHGPEGPCGYAAKGRHASPSAQSWSLLQDAPNDGDPFVDRDADRERGGRDELIAVVALRREVALSA
jgi:hypothetical protein